MRGADPDGMLISAICFFVFSVALVLYPDLLWTRWLSYCAAPVALGVVGVLLWEALGNELERVVADSSGVRVLNVRVPEPITEVAWRDVGAVKRKTVKVGGGNPPARHRDHPARTRPSRPEGRGVVERRRPFGTARPVSALPRIHPPLDGASGSGDPRHEVAAWSNRNATSAAG